jgi:hypothetical protein
MVRLLPELHRVFSAALSCDNAFFLQPLSAHCNPPGMVVFRRSNLRSCENRRSKTATALSFRYNSPLGIGTGSVRRQQTRNNKFGMFRAAVEFVK